MIIHKAPDVFLPPDADIPDLYVCEYHMNDNMQKNKVVLNQHLFSFLLKGHKKIHFNNTAVSIDETQSVLIKNGHCVMSEKLNADHEYFCKLFFFSERVVAEFIDKHMASLSVDSNDKVLPYFIVENDTYVRSFLDSVSILLKQNKNDRLNLLAIKFNELMVYLFDKYGTPFLRFLRTLLPSQTSVSFNTIIESNVYTSLKIEDIAFLCNMSLSTFKRTFIAAYKTPPGKWFKEQRLAKAKFLLETGSVRPTDIYMELGYESLSGFCTAFKKKYGVTPTDFN